MPPIASSPAFATLTTVLAVIAGVLGSVYQSDIAGSFPLTWSSSTGLMSPRAVMFWSCVVAFGLMFFRRQLWDDRNRAQLETLVRTMPPRAFQGQLAQVVTSAHRGLALILPRSTESSITPVELAAFARTLLNSIARLALIFDDQPLTGKGSAVYSANVMIYCEPATTVLSDGVTLLFSAPESDLSKFAGLLLLRKELSATSELAEKPEPDPGAPKIALPVPTTLKRNGRWTVLPGAPKAFLTGDVDGYSDASTLAAWCRDKGDFQPAVIDAVRTYFAEGPGSAVRSFISRPLIGAANERIGVLNVQSTRTGIIGDLDERLPVFQAMVTPLLLELTGVVSALLKIEATNQPVGEGQVGRQ